MFNVTPDRYTYDGLIADTLYNCATTLSTTEKKRGVGVPVVIPKVETTEIGETIAKMFDNNTYYCCNCRAKTVIENELAQILDKIDADNELYFLDENAKCCKNPDYHTVPFVKTYVIREAV